MAKTCQHVKKDKTICGLPSTMVADRTYLTDFCVLDSKEEKKYRTWGYPVDSINLCYFHEKVEKGLFKTPTDKRRNDYDT